MSGGGTPVSTSSRGERWWERRIRGETIESISQSEGVSRLDVRRVLVQYAKKFRKATMTEPAMIRAMDGLRTMADAGPPFDYASSEQLVTQGVQITAMVEMALAHDWPSIAFAAWWINQAGTFLTEFDEETPLQVVGPTVGYLFSLLPPRVSP